MGSFVDFDGYAAKEGAWTQAGADFSAELLAALVPGSILEISYKSEDGSMWCVFPDATPGGTAAWTRVAQGQALCTGDKAYITYEQIVAAVGENQAEWGARLQFEAATAWEVYAIRVGKYVVEATEEDGAGEEEPAAVAPDPTIQVADGDVAFTNSKTFADAAWWTQVDVSLADLLGGVDPTTVTAIKFTCPDTNFIVGYNDTVSGGWAQFDTSNTYVVKTCNLEGTDPIVCLYLSKGDGVEYTISWEVYTGGSKEVIVPSEPVVDPTTDTIEGTVAYNGSLTFADSAWWTQKDLFLADLIGDLDPATVKGIKFTSDTAFFLGFTDTATGEWWQKDATSFVAKTIDFNKTGTDPVVCLYLSKGDGVEYTINWEVYTEAAAPAGPVITAADGKGSVTAIAEDNWWTQIGLTKDELLAGATEGTIKLYADTAFAIGYNDATPTWVQFDGQTSYEVPVEGIDWGEGYFFCVVLRDGDLAEHTINWEVVSAGGDAADTPAADNLVITFADLTAGGYGYNATVNGDVVDVTIASQYQEIQYILPEAVDLAAYKTLIVDVTSNAQLDIKLVDPNAELNEYSQKAPFRDNYTAEGQAITEPVYIDLAEYADKDLAQINFMAMGADTAFTIKSITFVK